MTTFLSFLMDLSENPHKVDAILQDPDGALRNSGLSDEDQNLLKSRNWTAIQGKMNEAFAAREDSSGEGGIIVQVTVPVVVVLA